MSLARQGSTERSYEKNICSFMDNLCFTESKMHTCYMWELFDVSDGHNRKTREQRSDQKGVQQDLWQKLSKSACPEQYLTVLPCASKDFNHVITFPFHLYHSDINQGLVALQSHCLAAFLPRGRQYSELLCLLLLLLQLLPSYAAIAKAILTHGSRNKLP